MHADRRLDRAVADVVDVPEAERDAAAGLEDPAAQPGPAGGELLGAAGVVVLAACGPAPLGEPAAHDGQRAERAAVVVQLGGLVAWPRRSARRRGARRRAGAATSGARGRPRRCGGRRATSSATSRVRATRSARLAGVGPSCQRRRSARRVRGRANGLAWRGCVDQGGHDGRSSGCGRPRAARPAGVREGSERRAGDGTSRPGSARDGRLVRPVDTARRTRARDGSPRGGRAGSGARRVFDHDAGRSSPRGPRPRASCRGAVLIWEEASRPPPLLRRAPRSAPPSASPRVRTCRPAAPAAGCAVSPATAGAAPSLTVAALTASVLGVSLEAVGPLLIATAVDRAVAGLHRGPRPAGDRDGRHRRRPLRRGLPAPLPRGPPLARGPARPAPPRVRLGLAPRRARSRTRCAPGRSSRAPTPTCSRSRACWAWSRWSRARSGSSSSRSAIMLWLSPLLTVASMIILPVGVAVHRADAPAALPGDVGGPAARRRGRPARRGGRHRRPRRQGLRAGGPRDGPAARRRPAALRRAAAGGAVQRAPHPDARGAAHRWASSGCSPSAARSRSSGQISLGVFIAFTTYIAALVGPARLVAGLVVTGQLARAGVERVYELIDSQPEIVDAPRPARSRRGRSASSSTTSASATRAASRCSTG